LRPGGDSRNQQSMVTPAQLRAARALVDWSREELADKSGVSSETVKRFEFRGSNPKLTTVLAWRRTLQRAGVEFIDDDGAKGLGVRLRETELSKRKK
jgi:transcriptional regulator with XRE-family HTH domain